MPTEVDDLDLLVEAVEVPCLSVQVGEGKPGAGNLSVFLTESGTIERSGFLFE